MKKIKLFSNVLWLIGLAAITLVIVAKIGLINLPLISTEPYPPTTLKEIKASYTHMNLIFCTGYFFIAISIIIKICGTISRDTTKKNKNTNKNKRLNYLGLLCKIIIIIFTVIMILLSLFMMFLSLIDFSDIPQ